MASEGTDSSWSRQGAVRAPATATRRETTREAEKKGPRGFLQAGGVLGAGLLGDADHAPCGQARAQGCDKKAYRGGAADSGQSGLSDDSAHHQKVHKLIKGLQHIGQQQGRV